MSRTKHIVWFTCVLHSYSSGNEKILLIFFTLWLESVFIFERLRFIHHFT